MRKKWLRLLSILAMIILVAGISTVIGVLRPAPKVQVEQAKDEQVSRNQLSVAIVNEDTGTNYNGQAIQLGKIFSDQLVEQGIYQASIVSRSLANRGVEDGQYHLMVLIPSDFSEKAMGLELEQPQQAAIQYKVSPNSALELQQLAQNAANRLIGNMNQELISIYFSSILGNLVNAQTNVLEVVQREGNSLGFYTNNLMTPMNQFSSRFNGLAGVANRSESSIAALDQSLETTNQRFTDFVGQDRDYANELAAIIEEQTAYATNILDQHESMTTFEDQMAQLSVADQIALIQARNQVIEEQFMNHPIYQTVVENTNLINTYLNGLSNNLVNRNEEINTYLDEAFAPNVYRILAERLRNENNQLITLEQLNQPVHQTVQNQLFEKIDALPTLNKQEIADSTWSEGQKETFHRVIDFSNLFLKDFVAKHETMPHMKIKPGLQRNKPLEQANRDLRQNGKELTLTTAVNLDDAAQFSVSLPDKFEITEATVYYREEDTAQAIDLTTAGSRAQSEKIKLASKIGQQVVRLEMKYQLKENASVTFNEAMVTEFTIDKQADQLIEGQKKSIMDIIKNLFGLGKAREMVVQFFVPSVTAAELPEETETPAQPETPIETELPEESQEPVTPEETPEPSEPESPTQPVEPAQPLEPVEPTKPTEPEEEEEPLGDPFVITKQDQIVLYHTTQLVPDRRTLEQTILSQTAAPYQELAALVELYYGYNLAEGEAIPENLAGKAGSVMALLNTDDLADAITQSLVDELVRDVSMIGKTTENVTAEIATLRMDADTLAEQITNVNEMNAALNGTVGETLQEVITVQETLTERIPFEPIPLEDTEGMVTVATQIHDELNTLLRASEELIGQTTENKETANDIYAVFDELNNRVETLETEGSELQFSSDQFIASLSETYNENLSFAENFSQVMTNNQIGNRKNETLYQYLSQPIGMTNQSVPAKQVETAEPDAEVEGAVQVDSRTAFISIILAYLVSLLTAYVFHQFGDVRFGQQAFAKETLITKNIPISLVAAGTALLEGLVIGMISASQLGLSGGRAFGLVVVLMGILLALVMVNTWLLRQLSSIGMFVSLGVFTLYLISANQLMLGTYSRWNESIRSMNPLGFLENLLFNFLSDNGSWVPALGLVFVVAILFAALNLFVKKWRLQPAK